MFEYDNETIERILNIEGFDLDNLNLSEIKHVPMHQYKISTKEKPLLLVENLQVCIGLYAYSKNFAYAAHLNPVVLRGNEFICDEHKNIKDCNRVVDLYREIIKNKIDNTIYIGLSIGCNPVYKTYKVVEMLNKLIDQLIIKLQNIGINAIKLDVENNHIFIVDTKNENLIVPKNNVLKK